MLRRLVTVMTLVGTMLVLLTACATPEPKAQPTLGAPAGANPAAQAAMQQGNKMFAEGRWGAAVTQYKLAIQAQPDMGEAHYNLALVLEKLGENGKAREHYIKAANLAPGHKVIWNSPPLRRYGDVPVSSESAGPPVAPAIGGGGLGGGS